MTSVQPGGFWKDRRLTRILTPYAVQFRYPGDVLEPERADVDHALQQATALIEFVLGLLPDEVKPS